MPDHVGGRVGINDVGRAEGLVRCAVLGPVRLWRGEREVVLGPRQRQLIFALLLARVNSVVAVSEIVELLWGDDPPVSASNVIQRHVGVLRRLLEPGLSSRESGELLLSRSTGYVLSDAGIDVDLVAFRTLRSQAERLAEGGQVVEAVCRYAHALDLRSGVCGAGLDGAARVHPAFVAVDNEVSVTARVAADLALAAATPRLILPCLRRAAELDPYDEGLHARLLVCLAQDGRRAEALQLYADLRGRLHDEIGVEPGAELARAHRQILAPEPDEPAVPAMPAAGVSSAVRPSQLPADLPSFVGRRSELARMGQLVEEAADNGTALTMAIDGMPGVGKSTLAVHFAHRIAGRFPDGQLFLNLRGFDMHGVCMQPWDALQSLLLSLGVPAQEIPADRDARIGLYRSVLTTRRVLIVLDNARDGEQVSDLLSGSPSCLILVTGRYRMTGLAVRGGVLLSLAVPDVADAETGLTARLGPLRVATRGEALRNIVLSCGRLPLALAVVAARAGSKPEFSLEAIADQLRTSPNRLDAFGMDDLHSDIRAVFSWSYRMLSPAAARMFRLLALPDSPDISLEAAASLAGIPGRQAHAYLGELARASLLIECKPSRFGFHDLLRVYAYELVSEIDSADDRQNAQGRLYDYFRYAARAASYTLNPVPEPDPPEETRPGVVALEPPDDISARAWFDAEHEGITSLLTQAATQDLPGPAWPLLLTVQHYLQRSGLFRVWAACARAALVAAERSGDDLGRAHAHRCLAGAELHLERADVAETHLDQAESLFAKLNRSAELAHVYSNRGTVHRTAKRFDLAIKYGELALQTYRRLGNLAGSANQEFSVAIALSDSGDLVGARRRMERAARLYGLLGNRYGELAARSGVGETSYLAGDLEAALSCWADLLAEKRAAGDPPIALALELELMGKAYLARGDIDLARAHLTEALEIYERLGHVSVVQRVQDHLDHAARVTTAIIE